MVWILSNVTILVSIMRCLSQYSLFVNRMNKKYVTRYPPTVSMYSPDCYFGSIPEKLTDEVNKYITQEDNKK